MKLTVIGGQGKNGPVPVLPGARGGDPEVSPVALPPVAESGAAATEGLTVTLTPQGDPLTIPAAGGRVVFGVRVDNRHKFPVEYSTWTMAILPNGNQTGPLSGPLDFLLPAGWSAGRSGLTQHIPAGAPSGIYTYLAHAGQFPTADTSDSLTFEKLPASAGWYGQSPGTSNTLNAVWFSDTENGWAVSDYREIIHTSDGGASWTGQVSGTSNDLRSVFFLNALTGWCVGDVGTVLHTTNGGASWSDVGPGTSDYYRGVWFVDGNQGWVVGGGFYPERGIILQTTDGGLSWQPRDVPDGGYILEDIHLVGTNQGWASGGYIYPYNGVMLHME